jgi:hypothetical protein
MYVKILNVMHCPSLKGFSSLNFHCYLHIAIYILHIAIYILHMAIYILMFKMFKK